MRSIKKTPDTSPAENFGAWRVMLWAVIFGGILFFWPLCRDWYLAPRFLFLSAALLGVVLFGWKQLRGAMPAPWQLFDVLLLGWYGWNLASVSWAMSWSEGIFYAQKNILLFGVYLLLRQALLHNGNATRKTLGNIFLWITVIVLAILIFQIGKALKEKGLNNDTLYDYVFAVFGNKSLSAEFLFFLLIFNVLFVFKDKPKSWLNLLLTGGILLIMFLLQVRTVLLAMAVSGMVYAVLRAWLDPSFQGVFRKRILPASLLIGALAFAFIAWKGQGSSIAERLNPMNFLESSTANERRFVWAKTDQLNADHYWLGVGDGSWKFWLPSKKIEGGYRMTEENVVFTRAHNDYLEVRAETGMLGVIWFCGLFVASLLAGIYTIRQHRNDPEIVRETLLTGAGLLGYCIIQYFDFPRERIDFQVVLGVLFALMHYRMPAIGSISSDRLLQAGRWALALAFAFNVWIGWQRVNGEIHNARLLEAQEKKNWKLVASESALSENPYYEYTDASIPISWHEGIALYQLGQFDKAEEALQRAYRLNPWSFQVIHNYGAVLMKLKKYPEAAPLFEKALEINPRYDEGKFNLALLYMQSGDLLRSEEWLNRVDTIPNPVTDADRQKNQLTLRQLKEFRKVLEQGKH